MADKLSAVKGMNDILPVGVPRKEVLPRNTTWVWFDDVVRRVMQRYGYQYIVTPVVEPTQLFVRGLGEVTDIVEKEMYSFTDSMNGDKLTLRPEATAGIVRAIVEHNALYNGPLRIWTTGPMFRHERPQKGRYRQFHQLDVEALGFPGPDVDVELILMGRAMWRELGLVPGEHYRLEINTLGEPAERRAHREALVAHFEKHGDKLDGDARNRLHTNPLRILDTKNPAMQELVEAAPKLIDFLGAESRAHFDAVCKMLEAAGQAYRINPRLVRGMDYYNRTVFEWVTDHLGSQGTICGGGRYDGLIEQMGGKPAPAIGFGLGTERLLLLLEELGLHGPSQAADAYCVVASESAMTDAMALAETLRAQGVNVLLHSGGGSMKSQLKKADTSGARFALILGDDELAQRAVTVKPLRDGGGAQAQRPLASALDWAKELKS
ncbi:MAG TPA: histidine--tRNA ligase [Ramlibacter sp.]|nr:histidine--tRNA ligase [Ramlibacter sp.]